MEKRINRYLKISFVIVAFICVVLFIFMGVYMNGETGDMVDDVSQLYMKELNSQLQQKFDTIVALRSDQLEGLVERIPPTEENWDKELYEELQISIGVRDFVALGLYSNDGTVEMIYGDSIQICENMTVNCNCESNNHMIHCGYDEKGEKVFVLGKAIEYPMSNGKKSDVLFVVLPFDYFNEAMFLNDPTTQVISHIIDSEGNYIIKNNDAKLYNSIYERIKSDFIGVDGKATEEYIEELEAALHNDEDYSAKYEIGGEKRIMYISKLTDGLEWYIMSVMPYDEMSGLLSSLYTTRYSIMFGVVIIIIAVMLCVFLGYYRLSREQMKELHKAREIAIDANEAKSRFLTSMSHDIRTPMNAIIGMTDIAIKNMDNKEKAADCLHKVQLSSKHLLGLINDILDMSSIESGKLAIEYRDVALHQITTECVDIIQPQIKAKKQIFDVFIGDIISEHIYSDSIRMSQVLLNLLSNATKYTPEGGSIYLHIYQEPSERGDNYVKTICEVEDTGIGMSEEFVKEIFNRFSREDNEYVKNTNGSGLGMPIIKAIIDMMGGTIEIESEQDKGSKFRIVLDVKKAESDEMGMKLPPWKALVVDDNEQLCQSAADTLNELGLKAEWTQDGAEAVRMIEEHHLNKDDYHFALIDWQMPNLDGIQTIKEVRRRIDADIPMFIISAYNWKDVEEALHDTEIAGFISKPLFKSNLYTNLAKYVDYAALQETEEDYTNMFVGKTLLLAEDNDINAEIVIEILAEYGIKIERAENGRDCVEMFENAKEGYYSAVLMDVHMPIMGGYEATRNIRGMKRNDNSIPIIAMTADVFSDNLERCEACGMNACVTKPLDVAECLRTLKRYL